MPPTTYALPAPGGGGAPEAAAAIPEAAAAIPEAAATRRRRRRSGGGGDDPGGGGGDPGGGGDNIPSAGARVEESHAAVSSVPRMDRQQPPHGVERRRREAVHGGRGDGFICLSNGTSVQWALAGATRTVESPW